MTIEIFVENLAKQYHTQSSDQMAMRGINLSIASGQLFGLVGPDGAGKTTLIRILSTVINDTQGKAEISGMDVQ